jgi:hypothetical protein
MNNKDRLADIEARLQAATPGPWAWNSRNGNSYLVTVSDSPPHIIVLGFPCGIEKGTGFPRDAMGRADAALIADAPEDLAWCVAEIHRLREGR